MSAPPVSVVIPAYNRAATIGVAIESVLRQSFAGFELVVVDDGSTDGTAEAVEAISDPRLRLVRTPKNGGAAAARNLGVAEARAPWVAFQDSDDEWMPLKLEKQMARLPEGTPHLGAYCGLLTIGGLDGNTGGDTGGDTGGGTGGRTAVRYRPEAGRAPVEGHILAPLLESNMVSTQTLVVRREAFEALGGFDEALPAMEDWDFALRLANAGTLAFVDEPLVHQRFSPNSLTRDLARQLRAHELIVARNIGLYEGRPERLARTYYIMAGDYRRSGDIAAARRCLALARRARPASPRISAMSLYAGLKGLASPRGRGPGG